MTLSRIEAIHNYRRLQKNPYACIEDIEEISAIRNARKISEDPYSHIEDLEAYFGAPDRAKPGRTVGRAAPTREGDDRFEVERIARDLQINMWKDRTKMFGNSRAISPFAMLDPLAALRYVGFEVELHDSLGQYRDPRGSFEVAGYINQKEKVVRLASQLPRSFRNFTAAHELGHALMHHKMEMHRDMPLDGSVIPKTIEEIQANKFAAFFLMPRKLMTTEFQRIFGRAPLELDDDLEFALFGAHQQRPRGLREVSRTLAMSTRFNGQNLIPFAELFNVSGEAMAIRLEELELVVPRSI